MLQQEDIFTLETEILLFVIFGNITKSDNFYLIFQKQFFNLNYFNLLKYLEISSIRLIHNLRKYFIENQINNSCVCLFYQILDYFSEIQISTHVGYFWIIAVREKYMNIDICESLSFCSLIVYIKLINISLSMIYFSYSMLLFRENYYIHRAVILSVFPWIVYIWTKFKIEIVNVK